MDVVLTTALEVLESLLELRLVRRCFEESFTVTNRQRVVRVLEPWDGCTTSTWRREQEGLC